MQLLVLHDEIHRFQRFFFLLRGESNNDVAMDGNPQIHTVVGNPPDPLLLDALLHEIHDALIERLQSKHDLETTRITHGRQEFTGEVLFEPHFAGPLDVQLMLRHLLTEPLGGSQRKTFVGKKEILRPIPLLEPFQLFNGPAGVFLPEILVIKREGAERAIFVVAPARKLDRQDRLRREILIQRKPIVVRRRQLVHILRVEGLIDRDFPVLAIDQVRHLAEIFLPGHLIDQLQQRRLSLKHHNVVGDIEQTRTATNIIDQAGKDTAPDRNMQIRSRFLDQSAQRQAWNNLRSGRNRHPDKIRAIVHDRWNEFIAEQADVRILRLIPNDLHEVFRRIDRIIVELIVHDRQSGREIHRRHQFQPFIDHEETAAIGIEVIKRLATQRLFCQLHPIDQIGEPIE